MTTDEGKELRMDESDGIAEAVDQHLRVALTVAMQMGERYARIRQDHARRAEARGTQEDRELRVRFESERAAVRAALAPVLNPDWWDHATVEDIANARADTIGWRDHDDVAQIVDTTICREIEQRYGINVDTPGADPATVAAALRNAEAARAREAKEEDRDTTEVAAAQGGLDASDRRERVATAAAEAEWDSAERREAFAVSLEGTVDEQARFARLQADLDQATHPRAAVTEPTASTRPTGRSALGRDREHDQGLSR
jgi:hypothetical protein